MHDIRIYCLFISRIRSLQHSLDCGMYYILNLPDTSNHSHLCDVNQLAQETLTEYSYLSRISKSFSLSICLSAPNLGLTRYCIFLRDSLLFKYSAFFLLTHDLHSKFIPLLLMFYHSVIFLFNFILQLHHKTLFIKLYKLSSLIAYAFYKVKRTKNSFEINSF